VYAIGPLTGGVPGQAKNLIFAADGPKPQIILSDAINNDIRIVKHAEHCLVYPKPMPLLGLRWKDLVSWWADENGLDGGPETARGLYRRLEKSLGSEPEKLLFHNYFKTFLGPMGESLPAIIPQVYLHYDPYTVRQLGVARLLRQRMDFLLLLSHSQRIVIEVDGKQHYSEDDKPSPRLYAEMVAADRELRLAGYEVYRVGGYELMPNTAERVVADLFQRLFTKHAVGATGCSPFPKVTK
jgi:very-short-patch-repair endonuclease